MDIRRVLGIEGRITIPYAIRMKLRINTNDVLTFSTTDDPNVVLIKKEKICDNCADNVKNEDMDWTQMFEAMSLQERKSALLYLSQMIADS